MPKPPDRLPSLLQPKPIRVEADSRGYPIAVWGGRPERRVQVASIIDRWKIHDEWWRAVEESGGEIHRSYYRLELDSGRILDVFRDEIHGRWYAQPTSERLDKPAPVDVWAERREQGGMSVGTKVTRA